MPPSSFFICFINFFKRWWIRKLNPLICVPTQRYDLMTLPLLHPCLLSGGCRGSAGSRLVLVLIQCKPTTSSSEITQRSEPSQLISWLRWTARLSSWLRNKQKQQLQGTFLKEDSPGCRVFRSITITSPECCIIFEKDKSRLWIATVHLSTFACILRGPHFNLKPIFSPLRRITGEFHGKLEPSLLQWVHH